MSWRAGMTSHYRLSLSAVAVWLLLRSPCRDASCLLELLSPSLLGKMMILFEICLLYCCPYHPAVIMAASGNRAAHLTAAPECVKSINYFCNIWYSADASLSSSKPHARLDLCFHWLDNGFWNIFSWVASCCISHVWSGVTITAFMVLLWKADQGNLHIK